jgi:hypothetical protein
MQNLARELAPELFKITHKVDAAAATAGSRCICRCLSESGEDVTGLEEDKLALVRGRKNSSCSAKVAS